MTSPNVSNKYIYRDILAGLDVSSDEFWTQIQAPLDRDSLYIIKLRKLEFGPSAPAIEGPATGATINRQEEAYNQLVRKWINSANIIIIDKSLSLE